MKKQLLFNLTKFLSQKMSYGMTTFLVLTLLFVQSSFSQQWDIMGNEQLIASLSTKSRSMVILNESGNEIPYVSYSENSIPKVKKRNIDGTWIQVGGDIDTGLYNNFMDLTADANGKLYVSYLLANKYVNVKTYNTATGFWEPLNNDNNNKTISSANGGWADPTKYISPRATMAFDSSNNPYISYTADGLCYIKKYNTTTNAWDSFGNRIDAISPVASQKILFDENGDLWVATLSMGAGAAYNVSTSPIKLFKYNVANNTFDDTASSSLPAISVRELDMTLIKGTGQTNSGKIAIAANPSVLSTKVFLYNRTTNAWDAGTFLGASSVKNCNNINIIGDDAGNLYCNFIDTRATTAVNDTRVRKLLAGSSTWSELSEPSNTTTTGVDVPVSSTDIGIGSGLNAQPYVIYAKTNSASVVTPILRKYNTVKETTWLGAAWSNTTGPTPTYDAIINGTYSTTTNGAFTTKKLTVNAGKSLTINTGTTLTVQNEVISNGTTVVENNANLGAKKPV
jgi:hypothetical protein